MLHLTSDSHWRIRAIVTPLVLCAGLLAGCVTKPLWDERRLATLLPADVILLGEQHDAREHQQIHKSVVATLAQQGQLTALAIEMADAGRSTRGLPIDSTEQSIRDALQWKEAAWPWSAYGPAIMTAVRAGVPVLGANLPHDQMRAAMSDPGLDGLLPGPALKAQQQNIRLGHCDLLPESQITPMTRIQIARDRSMASVLQQALKTGQTTVLLAGNGHVDRQLGVPQHLSAKLTTRAVALQAGDNNNPIAGAYDARWVTPALPDKDYCTGVTANRP